MTSPKYVLYYIVQQEHYTNWRIQTNTKSNPGISQTTDDLDSVYGSTKARYWVTAIDPFMSGWGPAEGKINMLVIECENGMDQDIVYHNAKARSDMKRVTRRVHKPKPNINKYYVSYKTLDKYRNWHKADYFSK